MNKLRTAFFGLGEMRNPEGHAEFNWWHSSDHQPENLAIPGVFLARRYYAEPALAAARPAVDPAITGADYLFIYFMQDPVPQTIRDFSYIGWHTRNLSRMYMKFRMHTAGHFDFMGAWKPPRTVVSTEAAPHVPHTGAYLEMSDLQDMSKKADVLRWYEEKHVPDMLTLEGVTAAYLFWSRGGQVGQGIVNPVERFAALYYLDGVPEVTAVDLKDRSSAWRVAGRLLDPAWLKPVLNGPFALAPTGPVAPAGDR